MALTVKRKSGILIPKTPKLILPNTAGIFGTHVSKMNEEEIIESEIRKLLKESINVRTSTAVRRVQFLPIYTSVSGEKEISKVYLRHRTLKLTKVLDVEEIEKTGIMLVEFFDYLFRNNAKELKANMNVLEIM